MRKLGVGVIGVGFWGRNHARVYSENENVRLMAVCDTDERKAKTIGEKYGVRWYTREEDFLKDEDVDALSICTPTKTHADIVIKSIRAGKHVLVEKPMTSTSDEAKTVLEVSQKEGVRVMVGFIERFNPGVYRLKSLIKRGRLGEVVLTTARRVGRWPERIGDVGVVKDAAIHDLDIARFIFDEDPISVYARAGSLGHRLEDYAEILLRFSGIKTAFVEANWLTPHKVRTLTVTGSEAIASLDYLTQEITIENASKLVKPAYKWVEPLTLEIKHFVDSILKNKEPAVSCIDGLKALKIAEAALKSAKLGRVIKIHC